MVSHDCGATFVTPHPPGERYTDASAYPQPTDPLVFLHVDASLVVVAKPAFLPSENTRHLKDSVRSRVVAELASRGEPIAGLHLVHRLDWETSGLLVLARTADAMRSLSMQFEGREVDKVYVADIVGARGPAAPAGRISMPLSPDPDRRPLQRIDYGQTGRQATTDWAVVEARPGAWRVRLEPASGRRHQLRVHMLAAFGCAIAGDALYGAHSEDAPRVQLVCVAGMSGESVRVRAVCGAGLGSCCSRLHLHAAELAFTHPATGQRVAFVSDPPFALAEAVSETTRTLAGARTCAGMGGRVVGLASEALTHAGAEHRVY